jgi:hypothetical protein
MYEVNNNKSNTLKWKALRHKEHIVSVNGDAFQNA